MSADELIKKAAPQFNSKNTVIVVTPYPRIDKDIMTNVTGVATYSYHLTPHLARLLKRIGKNLVIIADIDQEKNEVFIEDNVLIYRCWNRRSKGIYGQILGAISNFNKARDVFIHFEFNMYGEAFTTGLFPLFLFSLRHKNTTLLLHQVAADLSSLSGHLGIERGIKLKILDYLHHWFYFYLLKFSKKVIVHDQLLKERLLNISEKPVFVVPHGLGEYKENCKILNSREYLNINKDNFVILCFGFLTWYKGSDWIVDRFIEFLQSTQEKNIELIMAGGPSANLKDKKFYQDFYEPLVAKASKYKEIKITGFVPDSLVPYYYCASDLVVLPYRTQMSASGPFAVAMSFDRPFLLSKNLEGVLDTYDIKEKMVELDLDKDDVLFDMTSDDFFIKMLSLKDNRVYLSKLEKLSAEVGLMRDWERISEKFLTIIDA